MKKCKPITYLYELYYQRKCAENKNRFDIMARKVPLVLVIKMSPKNFLEAYRMYTEEEFFTTPCKHLDKNDIVMRLKHNDTTNEYEIFMMNMDNIESIKNTKGDELVKTITIIKEVPKEVIKIKEVEKIIDRTDEVQEMQLAVMRRIEQIVQDKSQVQDIARYLGEMSKSIKDGMCEMSKNIKDGTSEMTKSFKDGTNEMSQSFKDGTSEMSKNIKDGNSKDVLQDMSTKMSSMMVLRDLGKGNNQPHLRVTVN